MASLSREWSLIKLILGQAEVVLKQLQETMQDPKHSSSINQNTLHSIQQASASILDSLQDANSLEQAAQNLQYDTLITELEALDLPLTDKQISIMRRIEEEIAQGNP